VSPVRYELGFYIPEDGILRVFGDILVLNSTMPSFNSGLSRIPLSVPTGAQRRGEEWERRGN
jgi:hypothetical protein